MDKALRIITLFLFPIILIGCAEQNVIEEIGFIHSVAYDLNTENNQDERERLMMTVSIPQTAEEAEEEKEIISVKARSSKDGRAAISRKTDRMLGSGQMRSVLFNVDLAKEGIIDILESLVRDHHIGLNIRIIVAEGTGKEILSSEYTRHPRTGRYITHLVEKETEESIAVDTSLHQFNRDYYDDGIDPICAILKKGQNELILDGIALFKDDVYIMKVNPVDGRTFKMLHGGYRGGKVTIDMENGAGTGEKGAYMTFSTIRTKRKLTVLSPTEIQLKVDIIGAIDEYFGDLDLTKTSSQKELEVQLADHLKEQGERLIQQMQEKKVDNLGIGQYVRNQIGYENWKSINWKEEVYPTANIDVIMNVKIRDLGSMK
ncbi:Ger(x)C family spore germination protein [Evansella tamaricis]|uniref:Ger(X)C family spore germination protein n=1 Tax=Evansella tamaricis TaxID=2069301 RepID=A0ABS6JBY7_9BACI|nr:Ger(x)C family spore germination protein [Evansella tamaricis]